ncbi:hypothetical protein [Nitratireductor aquibiodomus]|uniref:hypothetical protein n=1 Tax=Nitratireductor aquibiodomus TaxID=204799 RepID=UPI001FCC5F90|nr:hypothetical protein [Nitratireductor aquibiodomus]
MPSRKASAASISDVSSSGCAPVFMKETHDLSGARACQSLTMRGLRICVAIRS